MAMSMRSASARPGTRSRSISASATSCISSPISWCARQKRFSRSGKAGRKRIRTCWLPWSGRLPTPPNIIEDPGNRAETAHVLSRPDRIGVGAEVIQRTLDGRLKISPDGQRRESGRYLLVGREGAARPDPAQAAWLYAQMVRWGQTAMRPDALRTAMGGLQAGPLRRRHGAAGQSPRRFRRHRRLCRPGV